MDNIQVLIIIGIVLVILFTIGYYLYKEAKFRRIVEDSFNQATDDVITNSQKPFVLDGMHTDDKIETNVNVKDKYINKNNEYRQDPLFGDVPIVENDSIVESNQKVTYTIGSPLEQTELLFDDIPVQSNNHPSDSVEAFFAGIHQVAFPFTADVSTDIDVILDIGFEDPVKLKALPNIAEFTNKKFRVYILTKNREWYVFERGQKLNNIKAIKFVIELIDKDGLISDVQVDKVFSELHRFAMQNQAYIYKPNYLSSMEKLKSQIAYLDKIALKLKLFLVTNVAHSYNELAKFFHREGMSEDRGVFKSIENNDVLFTISDEQAKPLLQERSYNLLQINTNLHMQNNPKLVIDKIFDFAESFAIHYESRLLTSNKKVLGQMDFNLINKHVNQYIEGAKSHDIELGGRLIRRLFSEQVQ